MSVLCVIVLSLDDIGAIVVVPVTHSIYSCTVRVCVNFVAVCSRGTSLLNIYLSVLNLVSSPDHTSSAKLQRVSGY